MEDLAYDGKRYTALKGSNTWEDFPLGPDLPLFRAVMQQDHKFRLFLPTLCQLLHNAVMGCCEHSRRNPLATHPCIKLPLAGSKVLKTNEKLEVFFQANYHKSFMEMKKVLGKIQYREEEVHHGDLGLYQILDPPTLPMEPHMPDSKKQLAKDRAIKDHETGEKYAKAIS